MISDSEITACWKLVTQDELVNDKEIPISDGLVFGREFECDIFIASDHVSRRHAKLEVFEQLVRIVDLGSVNGTYVNGERVTEAELNNGDILSIDKVEFIVLKPDFSLDDVPDDKTRVRTAVDINKTQCRSSVRFEPEVRPEAELVEDNDDTQVLQAAVAKSQPKNGEKTAESGKQAVDLNLEDSGGDTRDTTPQENSFDSAEMPVDSDDVTMMISSTDAFEAEQEKLRNTFKLDTPVAHLICKTKPFQGQVFDVSSSPATIGRVRNNDITISEASVSSRHAELRFEHGNWHIYDQNSYNGTYVNKEKCKSCKLKHGDIIGIGRMQLQFEMASQSGISVGKIPLWLMAAVSVLILTGVVAYFMWSPQSQPKLSTTSLWMQIVADNREEPTTPTADDISRDGVRDIIIAAQSGRVEMINGANGLSLSAFNIDKSIHSAPLVFDVNQDGLSDIIVASDDGALAAYTQNGIILWEYQGDVPLTGIYNQIVGHYLNGDNIEDILVSTAKQGLVAVDGSNGKHLWNTAKYVKGQVITSPLVDDFNQDGMPDMAVVTDQDKIYAFTGRGEQVSLLWEKAVPKVLFASPVILKTLYNSMIFLATQENGLLALNGMTGKRIWLTPLKDIVYASPVIMQSVDAGVHYVIVATLSGKVVALNANDGVIVWETYLGRKLQTSPLLFSHHESTDKFLLIADTRGGYSILNARNGKRLLTEKQEGADRFVVTPLMVDLNNDGQPEVVLASQNGRIFAREFQLK